MEVLRWMLRYGGGDGSGSGGRRGMVVVVDVEEEIEDMDLMLNPPPTNPFLSPNRHRVS